MPPGTASPGDGILRNKKRTNDLTVGGRFIPPSNSANGGFYPGLPTGAVLRSFCQGTAQANASASTSGSGTAVSFSDGCSGPNDPSFAAEGSSVMPGYAMTQAAPFTLPHDYDSIEEDLFKDSSEEE